MSASGLVYQISSLITTSGVIQIFTNAFNIPAILRRLTLWWMKRDKGQDFQEYQIHLNQKFEYIEFDIAQRYSYYILQLWTVSFYAYIVPIGVPAMMIIFFFQYWVDKFNLFRRSSLFYQIHYSLSRSILKLAEFSVFIFALGIVVFSWKIHHKITPINIVSLVIGVIFAFLSLFLPERI